MKQVSILATLAIALAAMVGGCSTDSDDPGASGDVGQVSFSVLVGDEDVTSVTFDIACEGGLNLSGEFNVNDEQDPPIWATVMDLPVGDCSVTLMALGANGEPLCSSDPTEFTVIADQTVKVNVVLVCGGDGNELLGNVDIDATFVFVDGNACPRLHFLNAVPDEVPPEGSEVTVLVSDREGDPLTTALTATGGSFADPSAQSTTYTCNGATGAQTISVLVSDGEPSCDKSKSFDVTCPGTNACDGIECPDDGNECTTAECNPSTGQCETTNLEGTMCSTGGGGDIAINGGFETGAFNDGTPDASWQQFPNGGIQEITTDNPSEGTFAANLIVPVRGQGDAPVDNLIKNANLQAGNLTPGQAITVTWDMRGSLQGAGGVVFVELFSEFSGGGATGEIYTGAPIFPTEDWQSFTWETTLGADVSGGVTLQLKVSCGPVEGCGADVFFDNVTIVIPGGSGEPGMCSGGQCVPAGECTTAADCPDTGNECTDAVCNAGTCGVSNNTNVCDGGAGTCDGQGNCVPDAECTTAADCPDTGNECTDAVCNAGTCGTSNNNNSCDGGAGTCNAGVCEGNAEVVYSQNFESLNQASTTALGDAGFQVFGNVFQGTSDTVIAFYGPFPAPNNPAAAAFSLIASEQGGPEQGTQQLVIFSDYNNQTEMQAGNNVEALTFQEFTIAASDVGKTLTFSFQAKRGDIAGTSEAYAFIKTLAPPSFDQTNLVTIDTTNISTEWANYSITLDIIAPLVGQLLQFGFSATTTNNQPSGVFYDNLVVSTAPTP